MNGKVARMIRNIAAKVGGAKNARRQWNTFPHHLRGTIRAEYNSEERHEHTRPPSWPK